MPILGIRFTVDSISLQPVTQRALVWSDVFSGSPLTSAAYISQPHPLCHAP